MFGESKYLFKFLNDNDTDNMTSLKYNLILYDYLTLSSLLMLSLMVVVYFLYMPEYFNFSFIMS